MKVLLVNGSPNKTGCTYTALQEVSKTLNSSGIDTEIFWIGRNVLGGCTACRSCGKTGKCIIDDSVNDFLELAEDVDGFIFGSPVHYAAASGSMTAFMDRVFYANLLGSRLKGKSRFTLKPAACVVSARRAGTTATFDQLNKYFTINQMPVISSSYWNMVHGATPDQVKEDIEGLQIMRILGRNMAWFLKLVDLGTKTGIPLPEQEEQLFTNFIR